jgi:hypothetical protein
VLGCLPVSQAVVGEESGLADTGSLPVSNAACYREFSPASHQELSAACSIARHDEDVFQLFGYFSRGDAVITYFDPVTCAEDDGAYPFQISSVTFTLAHT